MFECVTELKAEFQDTVSKLNDTLLHQGQRALNTPKNFIGICIRFQLCIFSHLSLSFSYISVFTIQTLTQDVKLLEDKFNSSEGNLDGVCVTSYKTDLVYMLQTRFLIIFQVPAWTIFITRSTGNGEHTNEKN